MATLTKNENFLQPTGYKISINRKNYPNLEFFVQSVVHPSVSVAQTEVQYSRVAIHTAGDKILYDELTMEILLDEDMSGYKEMYTWLERLVATKDGRAEDKSNAGVSSVADITLSILSSHNNTTNKFIYRDCVPTLLGSVNLTANAADVQYITAPISFSFTYFDIV